MDKELDLFKLIVGIFIAGLVIGAIVLAWVNILGPWANDAENTLFNTSQQHLGAVAQKFSDDCLQLSEAQDAVTRKAIENDIYQVSSTVDLNKVQMPDTTRKCVNRAIQDVTNNH